MGDRILVAYATKYGGTAEIAERIGQVFRQAGLNTDVLPANRAGSLDSYKAVILGSAAYIGRWRKDAVKFLQSNEKALIERRVWLFSSGPTGEGDPLGLLKGQLFPNAQRSIIERIRPRGITVFHGVVDIKKLNPIHRWMISKVEAPTGDFRDWEAITTWATAILNELIE